MPETFAYMDDILVHAEDEAEHLSIVAQVFERLSKAGLSINVKKCVFGVKSLEYLGYLVDSTGITPLPRTIQAKMLSICLDFWGQ